MHLLAFCQAFNKQLIFRVPLKNNLANNMHSEKFALPSAKKIHSAKSPFNTRQRKTFVCSLSVSLSALGKLTYLPNVYFLALSKQSLCRVLKKNTGEIKIQITF
jgi:hypothetical protein